MIRTGAAERLRAVLGVQYVQFTKNDTVNLCLRHHEERKKERREYLFIERTKLLS